ncbi:Uncharacterized metal-binding protein YceD, DUF177 family [Poseidonocella pacifica]|uniref:Uncharacterized metal-binding protein YceD, DUF177 family n=1 Tax=Poseidonocella pacifica TaxID=871651 RepID=A0A1I0VKZ6_9RHOB|nr:DUF177 domain-containing protein [Poseidonocella pacifica]SFA77074.1 Uncharacterized metal-binding protein YceD, DUF177 family [Poseidonocella pacifica]
MSTPAVSHPHRIDGLARSHPTAFEIRPGRDALAALSDTLKLSDLRKLCFAGEIAPQGARDWVLRGTLGATVVQPCVVTLKPVTTRIEERILRRYTPDAIEPKAAEIEMPEDETVEPLPSVVDLGEVMTEALALALPAYPRADDASLGEAAYAPPGIEPLRDEDTKPFAGLAAMRDKLAGKDTSD